MENITATIENLALKAENYGKTTLELLKCNAVNASADVISSLAAKLVVSIVAGMFLLFVSIGSAFLIGKELGEVFYGFFIVSAFYFILAIILYLVRNALIKTPVSNFVISQMNNPDEL